MTLEVKKQQRENSQALIRRFSRAMIRSGILFKVRRGRFHKRSKSKQAQKRTALRREILKREYARLKKLGK